MITVEGSMKPNCPKKVKVIRMIAFYVFFLIFPLVLLP